MISTTISIINNISFLFRFCFVVAFFLCPAINSLRNPVLSASCSQLLMGEAFYYQDKNLTLYIIATHVKEQLFFH